MKKFKFYNVTPVFPADTAFVIDNVRRLRREVGLDCVAFSLSMHPQGTPATVNAKTKLDAYRQIREALADEPGLEIGVLVQSTIGHGWSGRRQLTEEPWQRIVMQDGAISSRMCPSDERFRRYILDAIEAIAETRPSFMLIDDDFGLRNGECFCPAHLAELNATAGTQFKTPQEAQAALAACKMSDPLLWIWEELRIDLSRRFAREIREAINRHDPAIRCGYCVVFTGFVFAQEIAQILAGDTEPLVRLANAYYLDTSTQAIPAQAGINAKGRAAVAAIREVLDESDTFPHTRFSESAIALHAHLTCGILDGLCSSKLWITDFTRPNPAACIEYERMLAQNRRFYDALLSAVDGIQWQGFVQPIPRVERNYNPLNPYARFREVDYATALLSRFGVPFTYERSNRKAPRLLCGANVDSFSDAELIEFLKGGLLLDLEAAEKFQNRGFAQYLGCLIEKDPDGLYTHEVVVETGIAYRSLGANNVRRIIPTSAETRVYTWLHCGDEPTVNNRYGPGTTCFVNAFGGRAVISAFSPRQPQYILLAHGRRDVLLVALEALNGGPISLRVEERQDVCARFGRMTDGTLLLSIFNANLDPLESIHLLSTTPIAAVQRLGSSGAWHDVPVVAEGESRYRLDIRLEIAVPGIFRIV